MARQGYISEFMNGGRILSHGKIENLADGFSLPNDALFSIYIRPKYSSSTVDAVLSVKCYQDDEFSDAPVVLNDWSPMAIKAHRHRMRIFSTLTTSIGELGLTSKRYDRLGFHLPIAAAAQWATSRRQKKMRLNTASSVMFIASKGKTVFKFLNDK